MSKHNYSQYSKKHNDNVVEEPKTVAPVVEETPVEVKMVVEHSDAVAVKPETPKAAPKAVTGVVANCSKLNVRANPATDAEVVTILDGTSEVKIHMAKSTSEWFKITTAAGIDGYCMRKFIAVNR
jgi:hypothetical protein